MDLLIETKKDLLRLKSELLDIKVELKFARFLRAAVKAGFNQDQPRDERGRWTDAGSGSADISAQRRRKAVIDYSDTLTGISTIDDATKSLSNTLGRTMETMDFIPEWTPQVYGTAVHVAFGTAVRFRPAFRLDVFGKYAVIPASYRTFRSLNCTFFVRQASSRVLCAFSHGSGGRKIIKAVGVWRKTNELPLLLNCIEDARKHGGGLIEARSEVCGMLF